MIHQWLAVAERIAVALERMAAAAERSNVEREILTDLRGLSTRNLREEWERRSALGYPGTEQMQAGVGNGR